MMKMRELLPFFVALLVILLCINCNDDENTSSDGDVETDGDADTDGDTGTDGDIDTDESENGELSDVEFVLSSTAFEDGGHIPEKYGCTETQDYHRPSIPVSWSGVPIGTKTLVLLVDDPDADYWVHWMIANIPPTINGFEEDAEIPKEYWIQYNNWMEEDFGGFCPPSGTHTYRFQLFAMPIDNVMFNLLEKNGDGYTSELNGQNPIKVVTIYGKYP